MRYTIPHYFDEFRCVAAECEDTCCAGWAIMIDEDSLEKYKELGGDFGNRLRNSINWEEGSFCQYNGRCAFLNDDNLCDLHLEAGEGMLCNTCRDYPRHMEEFEGLREGSLSLSCIEAAKIIIGCKEPVKFVTLEDDIEDEEYEDFDFLLFTKLMDAREKIIILLQRRDVDITTRIAMVLELTQKIQKALDDEKVYEIDALLEQFGEMDMIMEFHQNEEQYQIGANEYCANMRKIFRIFSKLEVLKDNWPEYIKKAEMTLYGNGQNAYEVSRIGFHKLEGKKSSKSEEWSVWLEQLMVYFVFTYFCGAVYDENVLGKMQTAVVATLLIQELAIAKWVEGNGQMDFELFVDIAHRVSREIEHSDINLSRLEKTFEKIPGYQPEQLLRLILY